jgi:outer membrane protein OmpA-like peptidoglycan-associated protein
MNPVSWWHDLEGGKIAEERPPPPGADQPYPNLASVPPKPAAPDRAALANIASALVADRTNAQHVAAAAPIADPSSPSASPELFGKGTVPPPAPPPPPGSQQASATMPAVEAPPAPAAPPAQASQPASRSETPPPPAKAPVGDVQSTPIAPPGATAQPTAQAAAPPSLPAAPPPPPNLPGTPPAPAITAAPPPPATAPAAPAPAQVAAATPSSAPAGKPANTVSVTFVNGSAELPSFAADTLKQLAGRRGNGVIAVTGYGDATSDDPDAQSAALALGLSRAKAMATALTKAGVPASAVQVDAEAVGRGGTARLVQ